MTISKRKGDINGIYKLFFIHYSLPILQFDAAYSIINHLLLKLKAEWEV